MNTKATKMVSKVTDTNILGYEQLVPPLHVLEEYPASDDVRNLVIRSRKEVANIINGEDPRLMVIAGPCSIHDEDAGIEYAQRLVEVQREMDDRILFLMRAYFEKPRTTTGWKGALNDPQLDDTYDIPAGIRFARRFLMRVAQLGLPTATEFLDPFVPQYISDLVSWGAIGARTAESQTHRQMASGLSMPIGFKNGTGGSIQLAIDGVVAARAPHSFLGIDDSGAAAVVRTKGNNACHVVLRGGSHGPNFAAEFVAFAQTLMRKSRTPDRLVIDCSHANCGKDHTKQPIAFRDVLQQRVEGNTGIVGVMLESHLNAGNQSFPADKGKLQYGVSITDPCVDWQTTEQLLREAYDALGA